jgi:hypothetical protein
LADKIVWVNATRKLSDLIPWESNPRLIKKDEAKRLVDSLDTFGQIETIAIDPTNLILDGHQREKCWGAAKQYGPDYEVDVRVASRPLTEKEHQKLIVYLHRGATGAFDFDMLANTFDVDELLEWGFTAVELGMGQDGPAQEGAEQRATLAERFIVPPFSVLDARQGYWQDRKRAWLALGIQSELGRGETDNSIPPNEGGEDGILARTGKYNAAPGGSPRPAASLGKDGHTVRGDGTGKPLKRERERVTRMAMDNDPMQRKVAYGGGRDKARCFGQDLMRGEHKVGG